MINIWHTKTSRPVLQTGRLSILQTSNVICGGTTFIEECKRFVHGLYLDAYFTVYLLKGD